MTKIWTKIWAVISQPPVAITGILTTVILGILIRTWSLRHHVDYFRWWTFAFVAIGSVTALYFRLNSSVNAKKNLLQRNTPRIRIEQIQTVHHHGFGFIIANHGEGPAFDLSTEAEISECEISTMPEEDVILEKTPDKYIQSISNRILSGFADIGSSISAGDDRPLQIYAWEELQNQPDKENYRFVLLSFKVSIAITWRDRLQSDFEKRRQLGVEVHLQRVGEKSSVEWNIGKEEIEL